MLDLHLGRFWTTGFLGTKQAWKRLVVTSIRAREERRWRNLVQKRERLRTYRLIKNELRFEQYLDHVDGADLRRLVQFRSGVNDLEVERGRRKGLLRAQRTCHVCGAVEDEVHVLCECGIYEDIRRRWKVDAGVTPEDQDQTVLKKFLDCGDDPRKSWRAAKYLNAILRRRAQTMAARTDVKQRNK